MIYTSYFGGLKKLPAKITTISIAAKTPDWFINRGGRAYHPLAPKFNLLNDWKQGIADEAEYRKRYDEQLLKLVPWEVVSDLLSYLPPQCRTLDIQSSPDWHIALLCYEKPADFCHRHIVAEWLNQNGIKCEEYEL